MRTVHASAANSPDATNTCHGWMLQLEGACCASENTLRSVSSSTARARLSVIDGRKAEHHLEHCTHLA